MRRMLGMKTVEHLFAELGRDRIAREAGLKAQVLSRAVSENLMPSGWYPAIRDLCREDGRECPEHLFRWSDKRRGAGDKTVAAE